MKRREEHKSPNDEDGFLTIRKMAGNLQKMDNILSKFDSEQVATVKKNVNTRKKILAEKIAKREQKKQEVESIEQLIAATKKVLQDLPRLEKQEIDIYKQTEKQSKRKPEQEDIEKIKQGFLIKKENLSIKIAKLEQELISLKHPISDPIKPTEMVEALSFLDGTPYTGLFEAIDSLSPASLSIQEITSIASSLESEAIATSIKHNISLRKQFLNEIQKNLGMLKFLPNAPGEYNNISGFINNIKYLQGVFLRNQEIHDKRLELVENSVRLLIDLRGCFKMYLDPDKFSGVNIPTLDGGTGLLSILTGQPLKKLHLILEKMVSLTKDFETLYNFIAPSHDLEQNLTQILNDYRNSLSHKKQLAYTEFLELQDFVDLGFRVEQDGTTARRDIILQPRSHSKQLQTSFTVSKSIRLQEKYSEELADIVSSVFYDRIYARQALSKNFSKAGIGHDLMFVVLEYLQAEEMPLNLSKQVTSRINSSLGQAKYYKDQIKYTDTAISSLIKIQQDFALTKTLEESILFNIKQVMPDISPTSIKLIEEYLNGEFLSTASEVVYYNELLPSREILSSLPRVEAAMKFCYHLHTFNKVNKLQKLLLDLNHINIALPISHNFSKNLEKQLSSILFIDQIIKFITKATEFFNPIKIKALESEKSLLIKEFGEIENILLNNAASLIKFMVEDIITRESSLLDNFDYLISNGNKTINKNITASNLLDILIRLSDTNSSVSTTLLNPKVLGELLRLADQEDRIIGGNDMRSELLYDLINSGHVNRELIGQFLTAGADINFQKNGYSYLHLIGDQLTLVAREPGFNYKEVYNIPRVQYLINPEKQDQLIDSALYLIERGANVNLPNLDGSGFLTSVFSKLLGEQSNYLYTRLLQHPLVKSQLSLQDSDIYGRNLLHLLFRDMFDFFYSNPDKPAAKWDFTECLFSITRAMQEGQADLVDREGNATGHYLASSVTTEYLTTTDSRGFGNRFPAVAFSLNKKNLSGETALHAVFSQAGEPFAFYQFALSKFLPSEGWHSLPQLDLHAKNSEGESVLDLVIKADSESVAHTINTYMSAIIFEIGKGDDMFGGGGISATYQPVADYYKSHFPPELYQTSEITKSILLSYLYQASTEHETPPTDIGLSVAPSLPEVLEETGAIPLSGELLP